jgi:O-antigen ligase
MSEYSPHVIQEAELYLYEDMKNYEQVTAAAYLFTVSRYLLYALLIFSPLAKASVQEWAICTFHIITLFALTVFLLGKCIAWEWKRIKTPLDKPISALFLLAVLSAVFSSHPRTSLRALMLFANYLIIFYLFIHTIRTRSHLRQTVYVIIGVAIFLSVFGFVKQLGFNPFPWWDYPELNQGNVRMTSTFGNPNHLAGYMEMAFFLMLGFLMTGYKGGQLFLLTYLSLVMLAALMLSVSRGSWFGLLTGMTLMIFNLLSSRRFRHKKSLLLLTVVASALMFIILNSTPVVERIRTIMEQEEMTLDARMTAWEGVTDMIADHPLFGVGPGTFAIIFTQYQPPGLDKYFDMAHNDYLHFISETGLLLVPVMVWTAIAFFRKSFKKLKTRSRLIRGVTLGAICGVTAILVHSISDFNLHIPANAMLFTTLGALAVISVHSHQHQQKDLCHSERSEES